MSTWLDRNKTESLANYKKQQEKVAKSKGVYKELMEATTLTQAKKAVYGEKKKKYMAFKGHPDLEERYGKKGGRKK